MTNQKSEQSEEVVQSDETTYMVIIDESNRDNDAIIMRTNGEFTQKIPAVVFDEKQSERLFEIIEKRNVSMGISI